MCSKTRWRPGIRAETCRHLKTIKYNTITKLCFDLPKLIPHLYYIPNTTGMTNLKHIERVWNTVQGNKSAAVSQFKQLVAGFSPWGSQFVMYSGTQTGFVSERFGFPCDRSLLQLSLSFIVRGMDPGRNSNRQSHPNHKNTKQKEKRLNVCFYTAKNSHQFLLGKPCRVQDYYRQPTVVR